MNRIAVACWLSVVVAWAPPEARADVKMSDFGIEVPRLLSLRSADAVKLEIRVVAVAHGVGNRESGIGNREQLPAFLLIAQHP